MTKRSEAPARDTGASQDRETGSAGSGSAVCIDSITVFCPNSIACPRCGSPGPHTEGPGAGPHAARLVCGVCGRFLRWLPKPHGEGQP